MAHSAIYPKTSALKGTDALAAKRLALAAEAGSRAVGSWLLLITRRLDKPVGPEAIEVMGRLLELALANANCVASKAN